MNRTANYHGHNIHLVIHQYHFLKLTLPPSSIVSPVLSPFLRIFIHPLRHHYSPPIPALTLSNST